MCVVEVRSPASKFGKGLAARGVGSGWRSGSKGSRGQRTSFGWKNPLNYLGTGLWTGRHYRSPEFVLFNADRSVSGVYSARSAVLLVFPFTGGAADQPTFFVLVKSPTKVQLFRPGEFCPSGGLPVMGQFQLYTHSVCQA